MDAMSDADFRLECALAEAIHHSWPNGTCQPANSDTLRNMGDMLCFKAARAAINHYKEQPDLWTAAKKT
jgi:hypothetical protein